MTLDEIIVAIEERDDPALHLALHDLKTCREQLQYLLTSPSIDTVEEARSFVRTILESHLDD
jgi:hypothetical protein